ncbi:MAG: hypothetical protein GY795_39640 [Desulfobacterales bacterium]|nr:hypothetical protein [Desulfobacterales bacterium]
MYVSFNDKIEQVEQSLKLVISELLPEIETSDVFENTCSHLHLFFLLTLMLCPTKISRNKNTRGSDANHRNKN